MWICSDRIWGLRCKQTDIRKEKVSLSPMLWSPSLVYLLCVYICMFACIQFCSPLLLGPGSSFCDDGTEQKGSVINFQTEIFPYTPLSCENNAHLQCSNAIGREEEGLRPDVGDKLLMR